MTKTLWNLVVLILAIQAGMTVLRSAGYPSGNGVQTFDGTDGTLDLGDGSILGIERLNGSVGVGGGVGIYSRALRLAERENTNCIGSFKVPVIDPSNVIRGFDVNFVVAMEKPGSGEAGEGWSVNFGKIPGDHGTGEGGFAPLVGGLTIAFDAVDESSGGSVIEVLVGGIQVGLFRAPFVYANLNRPVSLHWDAFGLDLAYDGKVVCTDLSLPGFNPAVGNQFAFSARTSGRAMDVSIDNLKITTLALPVLETGGVVITEFAAAGGGFEDEFGEKPSWIELMNGSADTVDLGGWYLTDSRQELTKWRIPSLSLSPYNYLLVFASGRDRGFTPNGFLHATFKLARSGGYLALVKPDGRTVVSEFVYGVLERGVSFGEQGGERRRGYLMPPTPGTVNTSPPADFGTAGEVEFSHAGGVVGGPLVLSLKSTGVAGSEIRYTLDRTEPGPGSPIYTNPIPVTRTSTVRARVYAARHLPGRVFRRSFLMLDGSLTNFNGSGKVFDSNIPIVFLDSFGLNVDQGAGGSAPFRAGYAVVIPPEKSTGRASLLSSPDYAGPCGVHGRGESSAGFEQKSYALELRDELGQDQDAGLLGMPEDSDWVLYGPWSEKTLMRNKLVFDWMLQLRGEDGSAVRTRFVELFFNQTVAANGLVGYPAYRGVYVLMEKIKRGKGRVPLENLNSKTVDPVLVGGGYIFRKDKDDLIKTKWNTQRFSMPLQSFDPDVLNPAQSNALKGYVNQMETALNSANFRDPLVGYRAYLDPDIFIDAQWMLEVAKQVDGYVFSTYFHKDRGGRVRAGPLWDFNISLGNADYASGDRPTGWLYDVANGVGQNWYPRLHADPDYKMAHWDRYWRMRRTFLSTESVMATIDGHMRTLLDGYGGAVSNRAPVEIQNPVARHFRKWPRLGVRDWPNPAIATSLRTWQAEVGYLKDWLRQRLEWLDDQSLRSGTLVYRPPVFSHPGGAIREPLRVKLESFNRAQTSTRYFQGDIYYTLDGSDPRLPGGEISGSALKYSGVDGIAVERSLTVNARVYAQRQWSPLGTATWVLNGVPASRLNLVVSEVHFHPAAPTARELQAGLIDEERFEFVELFNTSSNTVDLSGLHFDEGIEFDFSPVSAASRFLRAGESGLLVSDLRSFSIRYPGVPLQRVLGEYRGRLENNGESLSLRAADGGIIQGVSYQSGGSWAVGDEQQDLSYVLKSPRNLPKGDAASHWLKSARVGGTPGVSGDGSLLFAGEPGVDSDGDGQTDLAEFLAGTDRENPLSRQPARILVERAGDAFQIVLEWRRQPGVLGFRTGWSRSVDLIHWAPVELETAPGGNVENPDGSVMERRVYRGEAGTAGETAVYFKFSAERQ